MKTLLLASFFLLEARTAFGCSPPDGCQYGSFVESIRVTSDPNTLAARVDVHDGGCTEDTPFNGDPLLTFNATVDVTTGEVRPGLPKNATIQWNTITPSQPNTEYALDVQGVNATLTGPNGFSREFSLTDVDGPDPYYVSTAWFVSEKLGRAYVFCDVHQHEPSVAIVNLSNDGTVVYAPFDYYVSGEGNNLRYYDDLQIVILPGICCDCVAYVYLYYTETEVVVRWSDGVFRTGTPFLDAVTVMEDEDGFSAYVVRHQLDFSPEIGFFARHFLLHRVALASGETTVVELDWNDLQSFIPSTRPEHFGWIVAIGAWLASVCVGLGALA
jgi:hypothetical protein